MSETETRRPVEDWAKEKSTPERRFKIAQRIENWPTGRLLTEAEYDAAVDRASNIRFR
jgi:hypothetical protein